MATITTILLCISILLSGIFGVTTSTLLQSVPVIFMGAACVTGLFCKVDYRPMNKPLLILSAVCIVYVGLRACLSPVYDLGKADLLLLLPAAGLFYLTSVLFSRRLFWVLVGVVSFLSLLNLSTFIDGFGDFRDEILPFAIGDEQSGMYAHRNFCGNLFMLASLMLLTIGVYFKGIKWVRILVLILAVLSVVGLVFASARGAYLGLFVGTLFFFIVFILLEKKTTKTKVILCSGALLCGILLFVVGDTILQQRQTDLSKSVELAGRKYYFAMAVDQVFDAPLIGSGSMSYSYKSYLNWGNLGDYNLDHVWVHNEFLQAVTDYGILGLLLITAVILYLLYKWIQSYYRLHLRAGQINKSRIRIGSVGATMMIGFMVNANLSFPAHSQPNLLIVTIGMAFCSISFRPRRENVHRKRLITSQPVFAVLLICIAIPSIGIGYKESKALAVFIEHDLYEDDANWNADDHIEDQWIPAYKESVKVAPSYLRYERLAGMLLSKYVYGRSKQKDISLIHQSLEYSEKSLQRHPFHAPSMANRARCLTILKRYEEANQQYEELSKWTKSRLKFFHTHHKWATLLLVWGDELERADKVDQAGEKYRKAYEELLKSANRKEEYFETLSALAVARSRFLLKNKMDDELDGFMIDLYETNFPRIQNFEAGQILRHIMVQAGYAEHLYQSRKPELSYKWFVRAMKKIQYLRRQKFIDKDLTYIEKFISDRIKFFKTANIKPAP